MKKREKYVAPLCSQSSMHELIGGVRPLAWTQMTFRALALLGIVYQKNCKKLFFFVRQPMPLKYIDFYNIIEKEMNLIQYFIKLVLQKNYG